MRRSDLAGLLRIKQWSKNLLVFAPMIFASSFTAASLERTAAAFAAMCLVSSSVYIFNDTADCEEDKTNPLKKHRPVASGAVAKTTALGLALVLCLAGMAVGCLLGRGPATVLLTYLALNFCYTLKLKQLAIIDAMCIAAGFVLRLLLCGSAIGVPITAWLCVIVFFLSLFMAFGKRKCELRLSQKHDIKRQVLSCYTLPQLERLMTSAGSITLAAYMLFTLDGSVIDKFGAPHLYFTIPIVAYGIYRYASVTDAGEDGDPSALIFREASLKAAFILWLAVCLSIIFLHL